MYLVARPRADKVKLDQLITQLRREILSSPKKAAVLGLLLLVAVWYWAPLVWGWFTPDSTDKIKTATTASAAAAKPAAVNPVALDAPARQPSGTTKHQWKDVAQWIKSDPRMIATTDPPGRAHPFDLVKSMAPAESIDKRTRDGAAAASTQPVSDPASLGLVLSSTIVGAGRRAALISGKTYQLGATIQRDHNGQMIEFQLTEIHPDYVVLRRGKDQYEVRLPEPTTSGRLELRVLTDK